MPYFATSTGTDIIKAQVPCSFQNGDRLSQRSLVCRSKSTVTELRSLAPKLFFVVRGESQTQSTRMADITFTGRARKPFAFVFSVEAGFNLTEHDYLFPGHSPGAVEEEDRPQRPGVCNVA